MPKIRADQLLVDRGLCASRSLGRQLILAGKVLAPDGTTLSKPGHLVPDDTDLTLLEPPQFVSRGAEKLLAAMAAFEPMIADRTALDLGASTGGFTDVLLAHGAARVFAVDVGTGQLHTRLRADPRVVSLEQTNARELTTAMIPVPIDLLVADLSFISLTKVLPATRPLLAGHAWAIVLIKPQFEADRQHIGKQGVVRDPAVRQACVDKILAFAADELGWSCLGVIPSPITGPKGNQEFLAAFRTAPHQASSEP
ncbi:MAG: TlyA family RNA methyltransferase [Lentisphaeria bacterium]|nr:TlyA family RNA methyltransferase [Lentisphaeria bacterium]